MENRRCKNNYCKKTLFIPIRITMVYLLFTLLMYVCGPFDWKTENPVYTYIYLGLYLLMLWGGYQIGIRGKQNSYKWDAQKFDNKIIKILKIMLVINLVFYIFSIMRTYGMNNFNISHLIANMKVGLLNPGQGYENKLLRDTLTGSEVLGGSVFTLILFIWNFFSYSIWSLGMVYFKKMNLLFKIVVFLTIMLQILYSLSIGTNIGVFVPAIYFIAYFGVNITIKNNKTIKKKRKNYKFVIFILGLYLLVTFGNNILGRGGIVKEGYNYSVGGIRIDQHSIFFDLVPQALHPLLIAGASYLTQGYYGFSLATNLKWIPMYGIGNSMQITNFLTNMGSSIGEKSFQARLEPLGWDPEINWHTAYLWFANDVGFLGVVLVMFLIGFLFAKIYRDSIECENPFAKVLIGQFVLLIMFLPCNNQLGQSFQYIFSFWLMLIAWGISRKRRYIGE